MLQGQYHGNHIWSVLVGYIIESKICERNSSPFGCIEMCSLKGDKQVHFHSASRWWQKARVSSAWGAMLSFDWSNVKLVVGMVELLGRHTYYDRAVLVQINGKLNAKKHHEEIMTRYLLLHRDSLGHQRAHEFILLDDNCAPHKARLVTVYLTQRSASRTNKNKHTTNRGLSSGHPCP